MVGGGRGAFIAIVTPDHVHFPPAKLALQPGFHFLSDKPATFDLAEAKELGQLMASTGLHYGLTHNYTGYPLIKEARALVHADKLGKIRKVGVELRRRHRHPCRTDHRLQSRLILDYPKIEDGISGMAFIDAPSEQVYVHLKNERGHASSPTRRSLVLNTRERANFSTICSVDRPKTRLLE